MTRRERKERCLEKRREWAESRDRKADAADHTVHGLLDGIPLGQPILVGHHSEKRHRNTIDKANNAMRRTVEHGKMADTHRSVADGIEQQLEHTIFSDDVDAVERLRERIAGLEARRERIKYINRECRKEDGYADRIDPPLSAKEIKDLAYGGGRYPSYAPQNLGGNIRRYKQRLAQIERKEASDE